MSKLTIKAQTNVDKGFLKDSKAINDFINDNTNIAVPFLNFAFDQVYQTVKIDEKTKALIILASMVAINKKDTYKLYLDYFVNQLEINEIYDVLFQGIAYCGFSNVYSLIKTTNDYLKENKIEYQTNIKQIIENDFEKRYQKGLDIQYQIFGKQRIDNMKTNTIENQKHIQDFLTSNCFGDYYSTNIIDIKTKELLTLVYLISLGCCFQQVSSHIIGNINVNNNKEFLIECITLLIPYIGYPKCLNALNLLNEIK